MYLTMDAISRLVYAMICAYRMLPRTHATVATARPFKNMTKLPDEPFRVDLILGFLALALKRKSKCRFLNVHINPPVLQHSQNSGSLSLQKVVNLHSNPRG